MEVVKAYFSGNIPPPNSPIVGISREYPIIHHSNPIDGHNMPNKHKQLPQPLKINLIEPNPIIPARQQQFIPNDLPHNHRYIIPPNFLLIPVKNCFLFISSNQYIVEDISKYNGRLVVIAVGDYNWHGLTLEKDAVCVAGDEDCGAVEADEADWIGEGLEGGDYGVWRGYDTDCARGLADSETTGEVVAHGGNRVVFAGCEYILLGVGIYSWAFLLQLFDSVEIFKYDFYICLVLEEYLTFHRLCNRVHSIQTHFLIVLINPEFIEVFDKHFAVFDIVCDVFSSLLLISSKRKLVW